MAAKEIPPAPGRRGAAHLAISVSDLQRVMGPSWGALEREALGEWELRASDGFTQRGNSALPVGDPGSPSRMPSTAWRPGMPSAASRPA